MAHGIGIVLHPAHGVPAPGQLVGHVSGDAAFQLEVVAGLAPGAAVQPAGRVDGFLRGHAVIQHAGGDGGLRLGLALAAHGAVDQEGLAVPEQHGRVQGVEGALAGLEAIDVRGVEGEEAAPVLEQHPRAPGHDAGTEVMVDALDQGNGIALTIHHAQPDGIALGIQGRKVAGGPVHADAGGLPLAVPGREQALQRDVHEGRVGKVGIAVEEGLLGGLDDEVVIVRAAFLYPRQVEIVEDVQDLQRGHALGVGREVVGTAITIGHGDGLHPVGRMPGEIPRGEQAAVLFQVRCDGRGDGPLVELVRALVRQQGQRGRQLGQAHDLAQPVRLAILEIGGREARIALEITELLIRGVRVHLAPPGQRRADREAPLRQFARRVQQGGEGEL